MNNRDTHLEVLINRYLDGEISAREMEDLRALVDSDNQAKDLFEQMQQLHRSCQDMVQTYVLQPGRPVEDLIATAWQGQRAPVWIGRIKRVVFSPFISGLAAGLLIAAMAYLVMTSLRTSGPTTGRFPAPETVATGKGSDRQTSPLTEDLSSQDTLRQVDGYSFRDRQGNLWFVEGLSEERIQPVAYQDF
jgi:hypothetical protein